MSMEHYTHKDWDEWLDHLTSELSGEPCGEDQLYEEGFKYLKASSSGVADVDYKKMFEVSTQLLGEKTKDLRIVNYFCLAASHEYGAVGLQYGLTLFNQLLASFPEQIFPIKDRAKKSVHKWFLQQQDRLKALVELKTDVTPEMWLALSEALAEYNQKSVAKLDPDAGPLSSLNEWIALQVKKYPVVKAEPVQAVKEAAPVQNQATPVQAPAMQTPPVKNAQIQAASFDSDAGFMDAARALIAFDKDKQQYGRMLAVSRAIRWGDIKIPPNEAGKTRIPEPREAAYAPIKNALANENYIEAFLKAEALFMEGAMHFNLDLQFLSLKALKGMGQNKLVNALMAQLRSLVEACPQLISLTYDSGKAFCSQNNRALLEELSGAEDESSGAKVSDPWSEIEAELFELVEADKLTQALAAIDDLPTKELLDRAKNTLLQARLLLRAEKTEFAEPLLTQLVALVTTEQLAKWHPDFSLQVWRYAVQCYSVEINETNTSIINELKQKMLVLNPAKAIAWC